MEGQEKKFLVLYSKYKKQVWAGAIFLVILIFMIIGAIVIRAHRTVSPSATVAYSTDGFSPATLKLLVDNQGTDVLFVNDSNEPLDISESSINPEVFQVGIVESKNITKPKKVHLSKPGLYTFTNNKVASQTATIEVITTEQLEQQ